MTGSAAHGSDPKVAIVGGGAVGLATALALSERGVRDVVVLEADYPANASSGLSVGIVQTQHLTRLNIALRAIAMRRFEQLERDHGFDITHNGYLRLAFDEAVLEQFRDSVAIQHELGIASAELLSTAEVARLVPDMRVDDVLGALHGPRDGFIDGHLYCGLLVELLAERGIAVLPGSRVVEARERSGGWELTTARGVHEADVVVNAAGAWANQVGALLGAPVEVRPERHQAVMARLPAPLPYTMPCVMTYAPGSGTDGLYFRHERPGQLVVGLHSLDPIGEIVDPGSYARSNDLEFLETVAELFADRLPGLDDAGLGGGWAGIYPVSGDGQPVVGPAPGRADVIAACGVGGAGIMLSPVVGLLAAEWILDGRPTSLPEADTLSPARFEVAR